jgi:hypothetical protein
MGKRRYVIILAVIIIFIVYISPSISPEEFNIIISVKQLSKMGHDLLVATAAIFLYRLTKGI